MGVTLNVYYRGTGGSAKRFVEEMESSGTLSRIRAENGNIGYEYYLSIEDPDTVLLVEHWASREALDAHSVSPNMRSVAAMKERLGLQSVIEVYGDPI